MAWLRPVCADCAGPVDQGRCPTCRRMRSEGYGGHPQLAALLAVIAMTVALVLMLLAIAARAAVVTVPA